MEPEKQKTPVFFRLILPWMVSCLFLALALLVVNEDIDKSNFYLLVAILFAILQLDIKTT